jgi:hypothetical protein
VNSGYYYIFVYQIHAASVAQNFKENVKHVNYLEPKEEDAKEEKEDSGNDKAENLYKNNHDDEEMKEHEYNNKS